MSIDIQVSRSKGRSKVKPTLHILGKGAFVFYKQLYLSIDSIESFPG